ncbi:MAG: hypothetical protein ACP5QA_16485, partial [Phycisphaerae bacterium]
MFSVTSKSRKSITILSAGAAALFLTGLGVSQATADNLTWNPTQSTTGGTNGNGTWNSSGTYWYDTTSSTGPVVWTNNDVAGFTTAGSGTYTVSLANGLTADGLTVGNSISSSPAENNYTFQGAGSGSYTLTDSGVFAVKGGTATLQNLTIDNTAYGASTNTNTPTLISEAYTATLDIGSGGYLEG